LEAKKIRILVVDDSALIRKVLRDALEKDPMFEVVGTAIDGIFALRKIPELKPDIITLDVEMPRMNGFETLQAIYKKYQIPVIMCSSLTRAGADVTLEALEMGAIDFIAKPDHHHSLEWDELANELSVKIRSIFGYETAQNKVATEAKEISVLRQRLTGSTIPTQINKIGDSSKYVVAIGISTGGPHALAEFLPQFPADFPAGIIIVQHMPEQFTGVLAERLASRCKMQVKEAKTGDSIQDGQILIARGNHHLTVVTKPVGRIVQLDQTPAISGHRPSVDRMMASVAEVYGKNAVGVIMTGMGSDGTVGLALMHQAGAKTLAQDEASSVIYGMPRAAVEKGVVDNVISLKNMTSMIIRRMTQLIEKNQ
jgi:two-component system chemotaxis response regulator CheB